MSVALYQLLTLLSAAPLAAGYWLVAGQRAVLTQFVAGLTPWLVLLALLPAVVALLRPAWLLAMLNWLLRKLGRPTFALQLPASGLGLGLLMGAASWLLWGGSFAALTFALAPYSQTEWIRLTPVLVTTFAVGYAIGILSLITPSGLGVREGAYYLLLVPLMEGSAVAVVALAMRLWIVLGEVAMAGVSMLLADQEQTTAEGVAYPRSYANAYPPPATSTRERPVE
jgi:hypothetical protein